jgi:hypothetical protein
VFRLDYGDRNPLTGLQGLSEAVDVNRRTIRVMRQTSDIQRELLFEAAGDWLSRYWVARSPPDPVRHHRRDARSDTPAVHFFWPSMEISNAIMSAPCRKPRCCLTIYASAAGDQPHGSEFYVPLKPARSPAASVVRPQMHGYRRLGGISKCQHRRDDGFDLLLVFLPVRTCRTANLLVLYQHAPGG